jgi:HEAT repeat protein
MARPGNAERERLDSNLRDLASSSPEARQYAIDNLRWMGVPAIRSLIPLLDNREKGIRLAALDAIVGIVEHSRAFKNPDSTAEELPNDVRRLLGTAMPALIRMTEDKDADVRRAGFGVLVGLRDDVPGFDRRIASVVARRISDIDPQIRSSALIDLEIMLDERLIGRNATPGLLGVLREDQNVASRERAAKILGRLGDIRIVPELSRLENEENDPYVRIAIRFAIQDIEQKFRRTRPRRRGD